MAIEKAFAIRASAIEVWDALWAELGRGDEGAFAVEGSNWPNGFTLRLELAGLPVLLSYGISQRDDHCEVVASIDPQSARYNLFQFFTFGHLRRNYEILLVQGLSNLKRALEGEEEDEPALVEDEEPV